MKLTFSSEGVLSIKFQFQSLGCVKSGLGVKFWMNLAKKNKKNPLLICYHCGLADGANS